MFRDKTKMRLVLNSAVAEPPVQTKPSFQKLVVNIAGMVRNETLEGRDYKVVPMVMLTEGVHAGSGGRLFYPGEELAKIPQIWNTKPVIVYHPATGSSGCDVHIIENRRVGMIMNAKYDTGKLKAEAWLEVDRCDKVDERIMPAVNNEEFMDISTGLFTENDIGVGEWNGQEYDAVARNYHPDHLAILPDQKGACKDAGLMLNKKVEGKEGIFQKLMFNFKKALGLESNILSHSKTHTDLSTLLDETLNTGDDFNTFIEDVFPDFFIYHTDAKLYKQSYNIDENDKVSFVGERMEVFRVTEFRTLDGTLVANKHSGKENEMLKKDIVENLIKNSKVQFNEKDREFLMGLEEEQLNKIAPVENEGGEEPEDKKPPEGESATAVADAKPDEETKVIPPEGKEEAVENVSEYIAKAPVAIQDVLNSAVASHGAEKAIVVAEIVANEGNIFTAEQLNAKDLTELKGLQALCKKPVENVAPIYNYAGQAPVPQTNSGHTEEPLELPVMNFDNK